MAQEPGLSNLLVGNAKASEADPQIRRRRPVGDSERPDAAQSRRASRIAAIPGLPRFAEGPLRLGDHRLAAGDGGHRCGARRAQRHRRGVRRRRGDDEPARREDAQWTNCSRFRRDSSAPSSTASTSSGIPTTTPSITAGNTATITRRLLLPRSANTLRSPIPQSASVSQITENAGGPDRSLRPMRWSFPRAHCPSSANWQ